MTSQNCHAWMMLLARILLALLFLVAGWGKLMAYDGTVAFAASVGLPMASVAVMIAIALELGGGILLVLGYQTKWVALALALFVLVASYFFHLDIADQMQRTALLKNLATIGGLLYVYVYGAGRFSIDGRRRQVAPPTSETTAV